jgi:hypothetical protein
VKRADGCGELKRHFLDRVNHAFMFVDHFDDVV